MSSRLHIDENQSIKTGPNYMINVEQVRAYIVLHHREQRNGEKGFVLRESPISSESFLT
jgi:hypothetical protein